MTAPAIVADLGSRGIKLRVVGDRLQFAPRDLVGDADLAIIRAHKPALLDYLAGGARCAAPSVDPTAPPILPQDDEPGIAIETPDRARLRDALDLLPEGPGDADETGLEDHPRWIDSPAPSLEPIDLTDPECPAWVFDDSLTIRPSDLRAAIEANCSMGG